MADNKHFSSEVRDHATDGHGGWTDFLAHRWPIALGIAVAALTVFDLRIDVESVSFLSALVVLMPLVYVGAAVVDRRRFAWVVLLVAVTPLVLTKVLDLKINLHPAFLVAALAFLALGAARGQLRGSGSVPLQAAGMLVFGAAMLVALYVEPDLGGCSWPSASLATPPGTPSTTFGTGWSRVRMRSSVPSWTSWLA